MQFQRLAVTLVAATFALTACGGSKGGGGGARGGGARGAAQAAPALNVEV
ncbi:MAG: hypothetical protein JO165_09660, partial [Candidatus Eremiobacteraeota bacterium]|nr:hypothetical protein [Candidatus Eremiobacteraeota bacterium]